MDNSPPPQKSLHYTQGGIAITEEIWRSEYDWLIEQGYRLRPRYSPEWKPSWVKEDGKKKMEHFEAPDGIRLFRSQIIDATRLSDGGKVALKRTKPDIHPFEEEIMHFLQSEELKEDPYNHCVPLYAVLHPPDSLEEIILVMPLLRKFDSPPFDTIGEGVDCFRTLLEGLQFLHKNRIAHRDLGFNNFMMDATSMYPNGYHFMEINRNPDLKGNAAFYTRTQRPPRYYIIDFGLSRKYTDQPDPVLEQIDPGGDRTLPELAKDPQGLHDPFKADIYYAGNLMRETVVEGHKVLTWISGYKGFEFLKPLIDDMVQEDPATRPSIDDALTRYNEIVSGLSAFKLRSRPVPRRENMFMAVPNTLKHWRRKIWFTVTRTPAIRSTSISLASQS